MLNRNGKLSSVSTTNVCRRDGDVLLGTNTLEDELHTGVPLLLKIKLTSILPPYTKSLKDVDGRPNKIFREPVGLPNILAGVPGPPSWSPKLINQ